MEALSEDKQEVDLPTAVKILARQEILVDQMSRMGTHLALGLLPYVVIYLLDGRWYHYGIYILATLLLNRFGRWIVRA